MRVDDLTLEVRNAALQRVGQITAPFMSLKATIRWCAVGEWEITLPGDHGMVPHLATKGSGIILLGPDGESTNVIMSGPTVLPKRKRDSQNPDGTFTFRGVSDDVHLLDALAFPNPSIADAQASSQSRATDTRTGTAESLLRQYVAYNITYDQAAAGRVRGARTKIDLYGASAGRGITITKSPRFQNLLELLREIVLLEPTLGFRMVQIGAFIVFQVLDARDQRGLVRFDIENGTLTSEETQITPWAVTTAIVGGQGEGVQRRIVTRQSTAAAAAESDWGRVIEQWIDQRDTDDVVELEQSGDEAIEGGAGGASVKIATTDDTTMQFGRDWRAGDLVTVVVSGVEEESAVTESVILANADGVRAGAALGNVSTHSQSDALGAKVDAIDVRVGRLERQEQTPASAGIVLPFAGSTVPKGWLLCDGAAVSRVDYAGLYAVIGTTYGAGNGSTTFNVPDYRGRVLVGRDTTQIEFDALGEAGGAKTHTLTVSEMPAHDHPDNASANFGTGGPGIRQTWDGDGTGARAYPTGITTGINGGGQAHNNLQPYRVANYIISTGSISVSSSESVLSDGAGIDVRGSGTSVDPYRPNLLLDWAAKNGPDTHISDYISRYYKGVVSPGGTMSVAGNGILIGVTGQYEVLGKQRGNGGSNVYGALSLNGDRSSLENRAEGIFDHDHVGVANMFSTSMYIGLLYAGERICYGAGPGQSGGLIYGTAGTTGSLVVKRIG